MQHTGVRGGSGGKCSLDMRFGYNKRRKYQVRPEYPDPASADKQRCRDNFKFRGNIRETIKCLGQHHYIAPLHATITIVCTRTQYTGAQTGLVDTRAAY